MSFSKQSAPHGKVTAREDNRKGNTLETIAARRSIRRFKDEPIPDKALQAILTAATQAPSGKNRQPWRFVVVSGEKRAEMVRVMRKGIAKMKAQGEDLGSAEWTATVMEQAPVTVFVFNPHGMAPWLAHSIDQMFQALVDTQSIGAAIQNMALAAQDLGLGSLWICDVFYAYDELCPWLGEEGQMVAALSLGYADESPPARPRKPVSEVTRWM
jgi:nitroreductase